MRLNIDLIDQTQHQFVSNERSSSFRHERRPCILAPPSFNPSPPHQSVTYHWVASPLPYLSVKLLEPINERVFMNGEFCEADQV